MKIATTGRGNVGGGLADLWEQAGQEVTRLGKEGGDVSETDAVLIALPGGAIEAALDNVRGLERKTVIDATNLFGADRPSGFESNAEFVKSRTNWPTAKSFNVNGARLYGALRNARSKPGNLWTGDEEAREVVEQLNRDAGYEPLHAGPLGERPCARGVFGAVGRNLEGDRPVLLPDGAALGALGRPAY